jgi:hypothetical protein
LFFISVFLLSWQCCLYTIFFIKSNSAPIVLLVYIFDISLDSSSGHLITVSIRRYTKEMVNVIVLLSHVDVKTEENPAHRVLCSMEFLYFRGPYNADFEIRASLKYVVPAVGSKLYGMR